MTINDRVYPAMTKGKGNRAYQKARRTGMLSMNRLDTLKGKDGKNIRHAAKKSWYVVGQVVFQTWLTRQS